jgi:hypothetical protein
VKLCKLFAQGFILLLQGLHTLLDFLHSFADLFRRIAWGDVLRAVPIVSFDMDNEYPLDPCLLSRHSNPVYPIFALSASKISTRPSILRRACRG